MLYNIFKVYTIKAYIIAKAGNNIRVYITKDYIIIENTALPSLSIILLVANQSVLVLTDKNQQLYHISLESYIYRDNILAKKFLWNQLCHIFPASYVDQEQN